MSETFSKTGKTPLDVPRTSGPEVLAVSIEPATIDHFTEYLQIRHEAYEKEPEAFGIKQEDFTKKIKEKRDISLEEWEDDLKSENKFYFLVKNGSKVIGVGGAIKMKKEKNDEEEIWRIAHVYVKASFRGGVGKKLLDTILNKIESKGGTKATLFVSKGSKQEVARKLYTQRGFKISEEGSDYLGMELDLTQ